ncbi:MAG: ATP-binding cassette domain-containing protein [Oscillospiraceae bacterium]|jgi:ABC-type lipoprotein export system ATPase subunit
MTVDWMEEPFSLVRARHPAAGRFADLFGLAPAPGESFSAYLLRLPDDFFEEQALERETLAPDLAAYVTAQEEAPRLPALHSLTITGGTSKDGTVPEETVTLFSGEIICILGPTGSGKSRLLSDIESLAQGDTPTGRQILVNGAVPASSLRYGARGAFVSELSQQMHFLLDETVERFLKLHVHSRMADEGLYTEILDAANALSGEPFSPRTPLSALSGGQSRALMIADTALLSQAPILLIDELENAGINREAALQFLLGREKLILLSTHDPVLSLLGSRRLILSDGRIQTVRNRTAKEQHNLPVLKAMDHVLMSLRERLRAGDALEENLRAILLQTIDTLS